jgi:hypothetical protein
MTQILFYENLKNSFEENHPTMEKIFLMSLVGKKKRKKR